MPGSGDSIQALKAGVMEIPDVIAVNKADHPLTDTMVREIRGVLSLGPQEGWRVPIVKTEASRGRGCRGARREDRRAPRVHRVRGHARRAPAPQPDERGDRARRRRLRRKLEARCATTRRAGAARRGRRAPARSGERGGEAPERGGRSAFDAVSEPRAYRLKEGERPAGRDRRVARGRIDHALDELRGKTDSTPEEAVHEARKDMKKLRALLRLARGELGRVTLRARERLLPRRRPGAGRDARHGRDARDARRARPARRRAGSCASDPGRARGTVRSDRDRGAAARARGDPEEARGRVGDWPLERDSFDARRGGLEKTYRRGRRDFEAARDEPTTEALHEWRKRVKELWYHHTLLRPLWPPVMGRSATRPTSWPTGSATTTTSRCSPGGSGSTCPRPAPAIRSAAAPRVYVLLGPVAGTCSRIQPASMARSWSSPSRSDRTCASSPPRATPAATLAQQRAVVPAVLDALAPLVERLRRRLFLAARKARRPRR